MRCQPFPPTSSRSWPRHPVTGDNPGTEELQRADGSPLLVNSSEPVPIGVSSYHHGVASHRDKREEVVAITRSTHRPFFKIDLDSRAVYRVPPTDTPPSRLGKRLLDPTSHISTSLQTTSPYPMSVVKNRLYSPKDITSGIPQSWQLPKQG